MPADDVRTERHGAILIISLNRPDRHNSISADAWRMMLTVLHEAERDDAVRVIVTRAEGQSFSVGADAGDLGGFGAGTLNDLFAENFAVRNGVHNGAGGRLEDQGIGRWIMTVAAVEKPWIAAVNGVAAGGGMALALLHHFRVGSALARFGTSFGRLGLGPEMGLSVTLPALVGRQRAMALLASSRIVDADEAHAIGLLDRLVAPDELDRETLAFADRLAAMAPLAVRAMLRACRRRWLADLRQGLMVEWRDQGRLFETEDCREGAAAMLEKRAPRYCGR